ncbi:MAG: lipid A deacylase LpxR family protein [Desulfuromonadales bacterium]
MPGSEQQRRYSRDCFLQGLFLLLLLALPGRVLAESDLGIPDQAGIFSVQLENDMWGSGSDQNYTHGTRISYLSSEETPNWLRKAAAFVPVFSRRGHLRTSYAIGQSIFTPDDISSKELIEDDRPYAGWLYGAIGLISDHRVRDGNLRSGRLDSLELNLGVVGPSSLAEETQSFVHKIVDSPQPEGWQHQLHDELGVMLVYDRQWQAQYVSEVYGLGIDLTPHVGGTLGNVLTSVSCGGTLRIGRDLPSDYGPPSIRPSLPGSGFFHPTRNFGWYLFTGVEGRYVLHSIFLDGNTFRDSQSVDREPWVGDIQVGLVLTWGDVRLSFTNIFRTDEFAEQKSSTEFGSLSLSFRL